MKISIELQRVGASRVAEHNIPLQARILQGGKYGADLLAKDGLTDVEGVKLLLRWRIPRLLGMDVEIEWIDKTQD